MAKPSDPTAEIDRILEDFRARASLITLERSDLEEPGPAPTSAAPRPSGASAVPPPSTSAV